jgi:hypothetical protein
VEALGNVKHKMYSYCELSTVALAMVHDNYLHLLCDAWLTWTLPRGQTLAREHDDAQIVFR